MWHKGGLLHACSITDFNIPVVGIHSLQVNTSKHCNKEKKHLQKMSLKPREYTLSDTFFIFLFLLSRSTELKDTFSVYQPKGSPSGAGIDCRLRKVVAESGESFYFLQQNLYKLRLLPNQGNLFYSK